jgi:putative tricarboxylic transport membrane protein
MMDKDKLRKADLFSGSIIFLLGLYIVAESLQMPMKDSWGGVQNVWYVSPAIFPLFVGSMITLLGAFLVKIALKSVGVKGLTDVTGFLFSPRMIVFLKQAQNIRFYAILTLLISFVFIMIPRIDFFLAAIFFLAVFIPLFYLDDDSLVKKMLVFYLVQMGVLSLFLLTGLDSALAGLGFPADILVLVCIVTFAVFAFSLVRNDVQKRKKFKTCMILAVVTPILIGVIFKYLLMVPMPFEGLFVALTDAVWYFEF